MRLFFFPMHQSFGEGKKHFVFLVESKWSCLPCFIECFDDLRVMQGSCEAINQRKRNVTNVFPRDDSCPLCPTPSLSSPFFSHSASFGWNDAVKKKVNTIKPGESVVVFPVYLSGTNSFTFTHYCIIPAAAAYFHSLQWDVRAWPNFHSLFTFISIILLPLKAIPNQSSKSQASFRFREVSKSPHSPQYHLGGAALRHVGPPIFDRRRNGRLTSSVMVDGIETGGVSAESCSLIGSHKTMARDTGPWHITSRWKWMGRRPTYLPVSVRA